MKDRKYKGKHLVAMPDSYVLIDIETTGLSYEYDEIIEIGAIRVENNKIVDEFSELIYYPDLSKFIIYLTGISQFELNQARKIEDVLLDFSKFIKKDDIILGYNVHFDINFLYDSFEKYINYKFTNDFVDIMRFSQKFLLKKLGAIKLAVVSDYFNIEYEKRHRALQDCFTTKAVYDNLKVILKQKIGSIENYNKHLLDTEDLTLEVNTETMIYNKSFLFTGKLESITRQEASVRVLKKGGIIAKSVNQNLDYLVMGCFDYCKSVNGNLSSKHKKAIELLKNGFDIKIIDEKTFLDLLLE